MKTELFVQNVKCGGCGSTITKRLQQLEGVTSVEVDLPDLSCGIGRLDKA